MGFLNGRLISYSDNRTPETPRYPYFLTSTVTVMGRYARKPLRPYGLAAPALVLASEFNMEGQTNVYHAPTTNFLDVLFALFLVSGFCTEAQCRALFLVFGFEGACQGLRAIPSIGVRHRWRTSPPS